MLRLGLTGGEDAAALAAVAGAIRAGGVAILPSDTLYGFSARYDHPAAIARIAALKGRANGAPFLLLIADRRDLALLTAEPPPAAALDLVWPGPVTLLLHSRPELLPLLRGPADTVAVRWPRDRRLQALIAAIGMPIISTSVNRQGELPLADPDLIAAVFGAAIDVLADGGSLAGGRASTIIDLTADPPVLVRAGAASVDLERLARLVRQARSGGRES